jgi:HD-GYP domain-containing protein (c-di-GMP phosphodiesterase class II)
MPARVDTLTSEFFGVLSADGFMPVPIETILPQTVPNFDLYNRVGHEYILYRTGEHPFTEEQHRALREHHARALHVPEKHASAYWRYVKEHITAILSDATFSPRRKAEVFHASAIGLTREVLLNPTGQESLATAGEVVKASAQLLVEGPRGFHAFLDMVGKDSSFYAHSVNVCTYGIALAQAVGLPREKLHELGTGLLLHDLGMVGVPDEIVNKPGSLDDHEWQIIRGHPARGLQIYEESGGQGEIATAVILFHHERMDGSGYPQGLQGAGIPLVARIAATVNVFDALTTVRPFRPARTTYQALACMKQELKTTVDQDLLNELIPLLGPG